MLLDQAADELLVLTAEDELVENLVGPDDLLDAINSEAAWPELVRTPEWHQFHSPQALLPKLKPRRIGVQMRSCSSVSVVGSSLRVTFRTRRLFDLKRRKVAGSIITRSVVVYERRQVSTADSLE